MTDLPVIDPPEDVDDEAVVWGVVLAAGTSSRFKTGNKLLAEVDGDVVVRRVVNMVCASPVGGVTVVVGYESGRVRDVLRDLPVTVVENPAFESGQASSVITGIKSLPDEVDAVLFVLGDMPFVSAASISALITAYTTTDYTALAAAYEGSRGNPVLFDALYFDQLQRVTGDTGARDILLASEAAALVETGDLGVIRDIDTTEDLENYSA